jgi:hypothetical protein
MTALQILRHARLRAIHRACGCYSRSTKARQPLATSDTVGIWRYHSLYRRRLRAGSRLGRHTGECHTRRGNGPKPPTAPPNEHHGQVVQAEYESKYSVGRRACIDFIDTYSAAYSEMSCGGGVLQRTLPVDEDQECRSARAERGYEPALRACGRRLPHPRLYPWRYALRKARIGYWKVQVAALHPGRIVSDSHTPPSIKAQMLFLIVGLAFALFSLLSSAARKQQWRVASAS